jgi:membrane protein DedA with SNARE-associated domain
MPARDTSLNAVTPLGTRGLSCDAYTTLDVGATANHLLANYGYLAVFVLPLLESTGLPVPGETMLLTAAVYAATTGRLNIALVISAAAAGAILGDNFGYLIGHQGGRPLVARYGRYIRVTERHLRIGERFFKRHGDKTVFLARFIAVLRTIGAFVAGASKMHYRTFLVWNAASGITWAATYGLLAYGLGRQFDRYQTLITQSGIALAIAAVVLIVLFIVFGRRRFERWALGDPDEDRG